MENTSNKMNRRYNLTSLSFNRFLVFRYTTAIFFFINLYWAILSFESVSKGIMGPISLLIIDSVIIVEQTRKYWNPSSQLKLTKIGYGIQIISNLIGIFLILFDHQQLLFPFINENGRLFLILFLLLGCMISFFIEWRAWKIEHNKDSYITHMNTIKNTLKEER